MSRVGVTIGKFMPLHKGHELLIRFGSMMMDDLVVVVSGNEGDEISVATRYGWVKEFTKTNDLTNVTVILHIDKSPIPKEIDEDGTVLDPKFQQYWVKEFQLIASEATHFVSSDKYGSIMADLLGIKWLPVDPDREMIQISGTMIRNDPVRYFESLSNASKAHYIKKIAIVGPESSGKSTLVRELAATGVGAAIPEYGRTISEARDNNLLEEDFLDIVDGQQCLIDIATASAKSSILLVDTEAYVTYLFSKKYLGSPTASILEFAKTQEFDQYIVMSPEVEWIDDGSRVMGDQQEREQFFNDLIELLESNNESFVVVSGTSYHDRVWEAYNHLKH